MSTGTWVRAGRVRPVARAAVAVLGGRGCRVPSFSVASAFADAGNPILNTIRATAVDNNDGTVTISVRGQWNWLSHDTDCNNDRAATGVGIIWNDLNGPGTTRGTDEVQTVTLTGATGGSFKLKFGNKTTGDIAFNATAATVAVGARGLSTIGAGNVAVTGAAGGPYSVHFTGLLAARSLDPMTATDGLSPGAATVGVATTTDGVDAVYNGFLVENDPIRAYVGTSTASVAGGVTNPVDEMVHPVDRGNVPEGYTSAGTDYPDGPADRRPVAAEPCLVRLVEGWLRPVAADGDRRQGRAP